MPLQFGFSIQNVAQQAMNEDANIFSNNSGRKDNYVLPAGPDGRRSGKA